jgi:hypothetical protein
LTKYDGPPLALIVVVYRPATAHLRTHSKASMTAGPYPSLDARTVRSEEDRSALRRMIDLCRQDTEVAFRPGLEPENAAMRRCGTERLIGRLRDLEMKSLVSLKTRSASALYSWDRDVTERHLTHRRDMILGVPPMIEVYGRPDHTPVGPHSRGLDKLFEVACR